jgi:hypothetical protein
MRRIRRATLAAAIAILTVAPIASAAGPTAKGFLSPNARPLGYSLVELATAWTQWGFGTGEHNPNVEVRCEQSPLHRKIYFLPVSFGTDEQNTCHVPPGSFIVLFAGGSECSSVEPEPYFGEDAADLVACVNETFEDLTYIEIEIGGRTVTDLHGNLLTTSPIDLPPNNLLSSDPGISMTKGYFLVLSPMSRGTHTFRAYDEFYGGSFQAGITYTIVVGR